jgi:trans-aconitate methyltransferase
VLDFGCGNGVLTDVVRQALSGDWEVLGVDLSEIAVENAKQRYPHCTFFTLDAPELETKKFDLLFTHHVLEHVSDLSQTFQTFHELLNPSSAMLHILPCGNSASFEQRICLWRKEGIDPQLGNRFFLKMKDLCAD